MKYIFIILLLFSCTTTKTATVTVTLNGAKSHDLDGNIVSWQWRQISGATMPLSNSIDTIANAVINAKGIYPFELTVTDNQGAKGKDTALITIY